MSKTNIKKNRNGLKNYWLYQSVNSQTPLGKLYYINIVFLIFTAVFSVFTLALGFIRNLQPIVFILSISVCIVEISATVIASVYNCQAEFGKAFVLIARRKNTGKFYSSLIDMFSWCVTVFLIYNSYLQL